MGLLSQRSEGDDEFADLSLSGLQGLDDGPEESTYDLDDWSERGRAMLRERLVTLAVPHRWEEELTLVVATADEAWVERVMDQVEDDLADAIDPDLPQVAYDLADWSAEHRDELFALLEEEAIPFGVEGDELFAHEIDEERVDELVEAVLSPEATPATLGDGTGDAMGELFVAADLLLHEPFSAPGALALLDARTAAAAGSAPYGMDRAWWDGVLAQADVLLGLLDADDPDDEAIVEHATRLRDGLRPFV